MTVLRQGDVCLIRVSALPKGATALPLDGDRVVLAYGEVTFHSHAVYGVTKEAPKVRLWSAGAERFLQVLTRSEQSDDIDDLASEYDEETDTFYWPAGWYELVNNWDDYASIAVHEGEVTHWHAMPECPTEVVR